MANQATISRVAHDGFYFRTAVLMLAITVAGFGSALLTGNYNDIERPLPAYLILHGVVLLAWFSWMVLQTGLIRTRNIPTHRKTGVAGIVIALLVIVTTPQVFLRAPQRLLARGLDWTSDMREVPAVGIEGTPLQDFASMIVFSGTANLISFTLLFGAAIWWRGTAATHKRLMLLASVAIFPAALARISRWPGLGGEDGVLLPLAALAFLLAPLLHDKLAEGRFHKASLAGIALIVVVQFTMLTLAQGEAARSFVRTLA